MPNNANNPINDQVDAVVKAVTPQVTYVVAIVQRNTYHVNASDEAEAVIKALLPDKEIKLCDKELHVEVMQEDDANGDDICEDDTCQAS